MRTLRPLQAAAITYRIAFGPRAGHKVLALRGAQSREAAPRQPLCADIDGFSVHAAVRVEAHERMRLEQLCRYITRPALSDEQVQCNAAGQVELELETPYIFGTAAAWRLGAVEQAHEWVATLRQHPAFCSLGAVRVPMVRSFDPACIRQLEQLPGTLREAGLRAH